MNSFYGGKKGAPFIIVNSYATVEDMANDFSNGLNYKAVQFDEYVIINTVDKNNPDNGRIYRRGYDLNALELDPNDASGTKERPTGGGIYIGTIVGPAGHAPQFELTTMSGVEEQKKLWSDSVWDVRTGEGSYSPTDNLVPGFTSKNNSEVDGDFIDSIEWNYISIRDKNNEDTNVFVGFKFPYTVFNFTAHSVEPYYKRVNTENGYVNKGLAVRQAISKTHPFYEYWDIEIPKGVKGDAFKNFRVITASNNDGVSTYPNQSDDRNNSRQILVYDYYNYDDQADGAPKSIYLGDYNMISNINVNDEGTITINYTHNDSLVETKKINWIKGVSLNSDTGEFKITYNNNTVTGANADNQTAYTTRLKWVDSITVESDGSYTLYYVTGESINSKDIFTDDKDKQKPVEWVKDIKFSEFGTVSFTMNTGKTHVFGKKVTWVKEASLADNGTFVMEFNNDAIPTIEKQFKWINRMQVDEGQLKVLYNTNAENEWESVGMVRDYSGFLLGKIITYPSNIDSIEKIRERLKADYPNGLTGEDASKAVIVKSVLGSYFFGYDYDVDKNKYNPWTYIGALYDSTMINMIAKDDGSAATEKLKENLQVDGIWFVEEEF